MGMKGTITSPFMSDQDNSCQNSRNATSPQGISPGTNLTLNNNANATSHDASTHRPASANIPSHLHSANGLTSGPRTHVTHGDRPNSAPPHHLEQLSGVILRTMGDHYQSTSYGRTLRMIGDQMTFESDMRRALSSSDLDRFQSDNQHR